jgi:hypothetical protein
VAGRQFECRLRTVHWRLGKLLKSGNQLSRSKLKQLEPVHGTGRSKNGGKLQRRRRLLQQGVSREDPLTEGGAGNSSVGTIC